MKTALRFLIGILLVTVADARTLQSPRTTLYFGDSLCSGTNTVQTRVRDGGLSYCGMIKKTLENSCTGRYAKMVATQKIEDLENFCPGLESIRNDQNQVNMVLMNLVASVVTVESDWKPGTLGDGKRSKGLLQLTPASDRAHGCDCSQLTNRNVLDPKVNLACGTHLIVSEMAMDRTVGKGRSERTARGIARSFGPFRDSQRGVRSDIRRRVSAWCKVNLKRANTPSAKVNKRPAVIADAPDTFY